MRDYYRNAVIVISSSGATSAEENFIYFHRSSDEILAELVNSGPERQIATRPIPFRIPVHFPHGSKTLLVETLAFLNSYKLEPINRRAWTLQGSVLARRLLTFPMTGGTILSCRRTEALAGQIVSGPFHETPSFFSLHSVSSSEHTADEIFGLWIEMIEDYTRRSLTYRSDILIAIGALAREYHTKYGHVLGRYLSGLWETCLLTGLLWYSVPGQQLKQHSGYLAPSWSWALCLYPVQFDNKSEIHPPFAPGSAAWSDIEEAAFHTRWYCEVVSFEITPVSELDPFGAIADGVLVIRGPLRPLFSNPSQASDSTKRVYNDKKEANLYLELENSLEGAEILGLDSPLGSLEEWEKSDRQYYWLALWYAGHGRSRGLILRQIDKTTFQRIGYAQYQTDYPSSDCTTEYPSSELHKEAVIRLV
ncbi:MAG: hypothetical protein Q9200_003198 [Gallowayella weberi]